MKYREITELLCCMGLVAVISKLTLSLSSSPLTTAETHIGEDEWREKEVETNPSFQNTILK